MTTYSSDEMPTSSKQPVRRKRDNLPKEVTECLRRWLDEHELCPYPTEKEKLELSQKLKMRVLQVNNWFINNRRRYHWKNLEMKGKDPKQILFSRKGPGASLVRKRFQAMNVENESNSSQESFGTSHLAPSNECPLVNDSSCSNDPTLYKQDTDNSTYGASSHGKCGDPCCVICGEYNLSVLVGVAVSAPYLDIPSSEDEQALSASDISYNSSSSI